MPLNPSVGHLWQFYLEAERGHLRDKRRLALDRFIDALLDLPEDEWRAWALEIVRLAADEGKEIPVRLPLFRRAILPALAQGVKNRQPGCARHLAHFGELLHKCPEVEDLLPAHLQTEPDLLKEVLVLDPDDEKARKLLIKFYADYLGFTIHEVPLGVLYDMDGATASQCEELSALLTEFTEHVKVAGLYADYEDLIAECGFHFLHYQNYLLAGCPGGSYKDYLSQFLE